MRRVALLQPWVDKKLQQLIKPSLVAWSGRKLAPVAPVTWMPGSHKVADLLLV